MPTQIEVDKVNEYVIRSETHKYHESDSTIMGEFPRSILRLSNGYLAQVFCSPDYCKIYGVTQVLIKFEVWLSKDDGKTWVAANYESFTDTLSKNSLTSSFWGVALDKDDNLFVSLIYLYGTSNSMKHYAGKINSAKDQWTFSLAGSTSLSSDQRSDMVRVCAIKIGDYTYVHTITGYSSLVHIVDVYDSNLNRISTNMELVFSGIAFDGACIEFEHSGDGVTPLEEPHIHVAYILGTSNCTVHHLKGTYNNGTWSWESAEDITAYFNPNNVRLESQWTGYADLSTYWDGESFVIGWALEEYTSRLTHDIVCIITGDTKTSIRLPVDNTKFNSDSTHDALYRLQISHTKSKKIIFMFCYYDRTHPVDREMVYDGCYLYIAPKTGELPAFDPLSYLFNEHTGEGTVYWLFSLLKDNVGSKLFWSGEVW